MLQPAVSMEKAAPRITHGWIADLQIVSRLSSEAKGDPRGAFHSQRLGSRVGRWVSLEELLQESLTRAQQELEEALQRAEEAVKLQAKQCIGARPKALSQEKKLNLERRPLKVFKSRFSLVSAHAAVATFSLA